MSPITSARVHARLTARVKMSISSIVTLRVLGWPSMVMARESPTRTISMPASSANLALG